MRRLAPTQTTRVISGLAVKDGMILLGKRKPGKLRGELDLIEVHPVAWNAWPEDLAPHALDHTELGWFDPVHAMQYMPCSPGFYLHYLSMMGLIARGAMRGRR